MTWTPRHLLPRPGEIRDEAVERCDEGNNELQRVTCCVAHVFRAYMLYSFLVSRNLVGDAEFLAALKEAVLVQVKKFPELVGGAESPTEVLWYMKAQHRLFLEWPTVTTFLVPKYSFERDDSLKSQVNASVLNGAIEAHVIPALKKYFVAYAEEKSVEVDSEYRDLWADSYRGSRGLKLFHTFASDPRFNWERDFDNIFEKRDDFWQKRTEKREMKRARYE